MEGRIPPYSAEAEMSLLGSMLLSKEAITRSIEMIEPMDFYYDIHGDIYATILELYTKNKPVDLVTLSNALRKKELLDKVGGSSYLAGLTTSVSAVTNAEYYAEIVKEKSTLRSLIYTSDSIVKDAYDPKAEVEAIIEKAEKGIFDITQSAHRQGLEPVKEALLETFSEMQRRAANPGGLTGLSTGFIDLDKKLSGMQKSDLILLAARPSMGKTALMVNIAVNAALKEQGKVAVFSLEMSRHQLVQRIIASTAHVDLQKVISGDLNEDEWSSVITATNHLADLDMQIDDTAAISPIELKAKARRMKMETGLDLIVIDYLQLMQMPGRVENRQQEISAISRSLKGIAKELEVPVIALSQLSRSPEARTDKRPILSDLRESGAIEQDADVVMFLYRDEYYNKEESEKPNIGEVIIAKHRNGPTGVVELVFKKEFTKFVNKKYE